MLAPACASVAEDRGADQGDRRPGQAGIRLKVLGRGTALLSLLKVGLLTIR